MQNGCSVPFCVIHDDTLKVDIKEFLLRPFSVSVEPGPTYLQTYVASSHE